TKGADGSWRIRGSQEADDQSVGDGLQRVLTAKTGGRRELSQSHDRKFRVYLCAEEQTGCHQDHHAATQSGSKLGGRGIRRLVAGPRPEAVSIRRGTAKCPTVDESAQSKIG